MARTDPYTAVLERLARSSFRYRRKLLAAELEYLREKGFDEVVAQARRFVEERLAPPPGSEDGRQTPYRGHPVFIAQHATASCCRGCLDTWHGISRSGAMTPVQVDWVVGLLSAWLLRESGGAESIAADRPAAEQPVKAPKPRKKWLQIEMFSDTSPAAA